MKIAGTDWYADRAQDLEAFYEAIDADELHAWWTDLLPPPGSRALDVGAGSGRDAVWLAARAGYDVVAVEPCDRLRERAQQRHGEHGIAWVDDALPSLERVAETGERFDVILVNAVWMHLSPGEQESAFATLSRLLASHGLIVINVRLGGEDAEERGFHRIDIGGLYRMAGQHGLMPARSVNSVDDRPGVQWHNAVFR